MSNPLVSVIMPVYNCVAFVDEAIESMVNQTYSNLEIFIIDDCSTDGTKEKLEQWAKLDIRIKPIYKAENTGYVESLNMAIGLSNGDYIARMDGDDISLPERIEKQVKYMASHLEVGVLGGGYKFLGTNKILIPIVEHDKIKIGLLNESQLAHPTVMFRASMLKKLDRLYKTEFIPCEDYEFWIYLSSKTILHNLNDILLEYRLHDSNTSKSMNIKLILDTIVKIQLEELLPSVSIDYAFFFRNIISLKYLEHHIADINVYLDNLYDIYDMNNKKFIYDNIEFRIFTTNIGAIVMKKYGRKNILKNTSVNSFSKLKWILITVILSKLNLKYDFCQFEVIDSPEFE